MKAAQEQSEGTVRKRGFDKTIILGIILVILAVLLVVSIVYGIEEILDILRSNKFTFV